MTVISANAITGHPAEWEEVVRKLQSRQMPPPGKDRPSDGTYEELLKLLTIVGSNAAI